MDLAGEASFRLNFDRMGKLDSALRAADHEFLPMGGVVRDDGRLRPVEVPAVLDSNHRIDAGNHAVESEAAVEVALVSPEDRKGSKPKTTKTKPTSCDIALDRSLHISTLSTSAAALSIRVDPSVHAGAFAIG
jgi:hypothetical protein